MILITGATGTTGRDVVNELSRHGAVGVRVFVRDASKAGFARAAGFEVFEGDFGRPETLDAALHGVERAFLLTPPTPATTAAPPPSPTPCARSHGPSPAPSHSSRATTRKSSKKVTGDGRKTAWHEPRKVIKRRALSCHLSPAARHCP